MRTPGAEQGQVLILDLTYSIGKCEMPGHVRPTGPSHRRPVGGPRQELADSTGDGGDVAFAHKDGGIRRDRLGDSPVPGRDHRDPTREGFEVHESQGLGVSVRGRAARGDNEVSVGECTRDGIRSGAIQNLGGEIKVDD
jgi:hypothetical protein